MSDIVIRVENLGKQYRIGKRERYRTLRDSLTDAVTAPFRRFRAGANGNGEPDYIWALKDVSFEIPKGEVVGIIGRNGAGKSTLLKVLSRITEPTEGRVKLVGRVASLLEVGTGFHSELTGRENIYLNGAILGMKKAEIARRFDEIAAFAEIEKFLDTPIKHYSSGMYMRLAFAVAAHLDPEILIVDEVLSVGDLAFQKKCLGKMGTAVKDGRTVVFVSHQMNQIRRLCKQCMWMDAGQIRAFASTHSIVATYEGAMNFEDGGTRRQNPLSAKCSFTSWEVSKPRSAESNVISVTGPIDIKFTIDVQQQLDGCFHGIALFNGERRLLWGNGVNHFDLSPGRHELIYRFDYLPLQPGRYHWLTTLYDATGLLDEWDCSPAMVVGTEPMNHARDDWSGILNIPWSLHISGREHFNTVERGEFAGTAQIN